MTLPYRILSKAETEHGWNEFITYATKQEAINYLENVNPKLRPALIVKGQNTLRAYDHGIIDYEYINELENKLETIRHETEHKLR